MLAVDIDIGWLAGTAVTFGSAMLYFGRQLVLFLKPYLIRGADAHIKFVQTASEQYTRQTTVLETFAENQKQLADTQTQHGAILNTHTEQLGKLLQKRDE